MPSSHLEAVDGPGGVGEEDCDKDPGNCRDGHAHSAGQLQVLVGRMQAGDDAEDRRWLSYSASML